LLVLGGVPLTMELSLQRGTLLVTRFRTVLCSGSPRKRVSVKMSRIPVCFFLRLESQIPDHQRGLYFLSPCYLNLYHRFSSSISDGFSLSKHSTFPMSFSEL
jgi:hypothetical protein